MQSVRLVLVLGCLLLAGCGSPHSSRHSPIFIDARGTCPFRYGNHWPRYVCLHDQYFGNGRAGTFGRQHGPWGAAYAFNCWGKRRMFATRIGLTDADYYWGTVIRYGAEGRGYIMDSTKVDTRGIPSYWSNIFLLEVKSECTWRIRAIDGPPSRVRRDIPPIPARRF